MVVVIEASAKNPSRVRLHVRPSRTTDGHGVMHIVGHAGVELRSLDGTLLGRWGENGDGAGHFTNSPHRVYIDSE
jgi:hypothetical protein|tara:strand:- start:2419 stop:2643 length:225 start_codon:yes stop_codon:yes gene_type:complete